MGKKRKIISHPQFWKKHANHPAVKTRQQEQTKPKEETNVQLPKPVVKKEEPKSTPVVKKQEPTPTIKKKQPTVASQSAVKKEHSKVVATSSPNIKKPYNKIK